MTSSWKLDSLVIENFRSISGLWNIPLNADIVLVHGPNGAGKTSLLSALELAATGRIGFLEGKSGAPEPTLVNRNYPLGHVELALRSDTATSVGRFEFDPIARRGSAALSDRASADFVERCFLPQTVLGRLLESYSLGDQKDSALVRFVKDLAGIEELDSLIDGLHAAGHVARTKALSRSWSKLEDSLQSADERRRNLARDLTVASAASAEATTALQVLLSEVVQSDSASDQASTVAQEVVRAAEDAQADIIRVGGLKVRLDSIVAALTASHVDVQSGAASDLAERAIGDRSALERWELADGKTLLRILNECRKPLGLSEVTGQLLFDAYTETRTRVQERAAIEREEEQLRLEQTQQISAFESDLATIRADIAEARNAADAIPITDDVRNLIDALRLVLPTVHSGDCPVCDQSFPAGLNALVDHIGSKLARLSDEAEAYSALSERLDHLLTRELDATRSLESAQSVRLPPAHGRPISDMVRNLNGMEKQINEGLALLQTVETSQARLADIAAVRSTIATAEDGLRVLMEEADFDGEATEINERAKEFQIELDRMLQSSRFRVTLGGRVQTAVDLVAERQRRENELRQELQDATTRFSNLSSVSSNAKRRKDSANELRKEAERVRSSLINDVFDTGLNQTWADLFSRLVPTEPYVPQFQKQMNNLRTIDVTLETVLPDGGTSGAPGSVLSFGNANTAALSLFLALHISAPTEVNWLIFDDPVQSMDDIHIANFAAVIRQLTLTHERQVVIAVHQRELFDYLAFELAPANPSDELLKIELERHGDVSQVRWDRIRYEEEKAISSF